MKAIIVYVASDGSRWDDPIKAEFRDALDNLVRKLEAQLPEVPNSSGKRIAVNIELRNRVWASAVSLARSDNPSFRQFDGPPEKIHPMGICGRIVSEGGGPIARLWHWFSCERDGWLYNQPFFALNPDKFEPDKEL